MYKGNLRINTQNIKSRGVEMEKLLTEVCKIQYGFPFDSSKFKTRIACEVKNYDWSHYFDRKEVRKYDRFAQFALIAAAEAVSDAAFGDDVNRRRCGVVWSSGVGGIETYFQECMDFLGLVHSLFLV